MLTKTANEWYDAFEKAIDYKRNHHDSNTAKDIRKYEIVQNMLLSVDENALLTVSGIPLNGCGEIEICNCGDIGEAVVRWLLAVRKPKQVTRRASGKKDWNGWEIKTALTCRWLPTKSPKCKTILVNACGVFTLTGAEVAENLDKNGRLPYNKAIGEPWDELQEMLGLWDE